MERAASKLAGAFCQVAWIVRDIEVTERFFIDTTGIERFYRMEGVAAADVGGTYRGEPADWVCDLSLAYSGDTQIEIIQPVSGASVWADALAESGDAVQHVAYLIDQEDFPAVAAHLEQGGFPEAQAMNLPIARVGYFDTRPAIGVMTEIIGTTEAGRRFFGAVKAGTF